VEFEPTANQPAIVRRGDASTSGTPPNLPGSSSAFSGLKAQWRALLSSLGGQFLVAGMGLILLFMLWQGGEIIFLRLLPAHRAIARIYSRMEKASVNLLPDLPNGHTPHELGTALTRRLRLSKNRLLATTFFPASKEIKHIVSLYVSQVFSEHPPAKTQVWAGIRAWSRLRWRLWLANRWAQYLADQSKNT
jgi:hypothetical protein